MESKVPYQSYLKNKSIQPWWLEYEEAATGEPVGEVFKELGKWRCYFCEQDATRPEKFGSMHEAYMFLLQLYKTYKGL